MIENNKFYIPQLDNLIIFGFSNDINQILKFNNSHKIKTQIITTSDQSKLIPANVKCKIFNSFDSKLKKYLIKNFEVENTLFVSFGCRYIFKERDISVFFKNNLVNFHGSRLPYDAGAGHFSWRIMKGDKIENQLVHLINKQIDKGPIIYSENTIFPSSCKIPIDYEIYSKKTFLNFYKNIIKHLKFGKKFDLKHQPDYIGSYFPRLNTNIHGWINWDLKSYQVERFIDAFDDPYPGASTMINNKVVRIKKVFLSGGESNSHPFMSGLIFRHDRRWLCVNSVDNNVFLIKEVLNSKGKNIISNLKVGDRFYTPTNKLENKYVRVKYNSKGIINSSKK